MKPHVIESLAEIIDKDHDGCIDKFDLESFLTRYDAVSDAPIE